MVLNGILVLGVGLIGLAILKLRDLSQSPRPVPIPVERKTPRQDEN